MSCVLRVGGKRFNVERFLATSRLKPCAVFRKGEPRSKFKPKGKKWEMSAVNILVSPADFNRLDMQIQDAIRFLSMNKKEINKLLKFPGVDGKSKLDFGVEYRKCFVQSDYFPPKLLGLAGALDLGICVSLYQG